jgi:hypothetical protein
MLFIHVKFHTGSTIGMIANYKITDVGNNTMSSELAEFLGIDRYIAQIIGRVTSEKLQTKNYFTC